MPKSVSKRDVGVINQGVKSNIKSLAQTQTNSNKQYANPSPQPKKSKSKPKQISSNLDCKNKTS